MKTVVPFFLGALALPCAVAAQEHPLQHALDSSRAVLGAPGVSVAVILTDGSTWLGTSGVAAAGVPVTPETVFEIGSVTKTFTAAFVLQLVSDGILELDDSLRAFFPDFPHGDGVTVRQLLNHTSGLHDPFQEETYAPVMIRAPGRVWTPQDVFELMGDRYHAPGQGWHYSNPGYLLLGLIGERLTGNTLGTELRRRFLEPLSLNRTYYAVEDEIAEPRAHPFIDINGDSIPEDLSLLIPSTAFITSSGAAGAVVSSAGDLARWTRALHAGEVLGPETYQQMLEFVDRPDGNRYGLGLLYVTRGQRRMYGHRGNSAGFSAAAWHLPDDGITVAVLSNAHGVAVTPIVDALLDAVPAR